MLVSKLCAEVGSPRASAQAMQLGDAVQRLAASRADNMRLQHRAKQACKHPAMHHPRGHVPCGLAWC